MQHTKHVNVRSTLKGKIKNKKIKEYKINIKILLI